MGLVYAPNLYVPMPQGRLTLTTLTPVMTATASAATAVLYTPYVGNSIPIYSGSGMLVYPFAELTNTLSDATVNPAAVVDNANYDLFVWLNAGVVTLSRGPLWQKSATVTTPIASPGLVNWTGHGLAVGTPVSFQVSGGSLPTGIVAGTTYYVIAAGYTANVFEIATAPGGAGINFTGTTTGTQTATAGNDTARGTGAGTTELQMINGIQTNKNAITNGPAANKGTLVGSVRTNASGTVDWIAFPVSANGGAQMILGVSNAHNRKFFKPRTSDSNASWTFSSATVGPMDPGGTGSGLNFRGSWISCLAEDDVEGWLNTRADSPGVVASWSAFGLGIDSTTVISLNGQDAIAVDTLATAALKTTMPSSIRIPTPLGWHFIQALQFADGTNTATLYGAPYGMMGLGVWA